MQRDVDEFEEEQYEEKEQPDVAEISVEEQTEMPTEIVPSRNSSLEKRVLFDSMVVIMEPMPPDSDTEDDEDYDEESDCVYYASPQTDDSVYIEHSQVGLAPIRTAKNSTSGSISTYGLVQRSDSMTYNFGYPDSSKLSSENPCCSKLRKRRMIPLWCWWTSVMVLLLIVAAVMAIVLAWVIIMPRKPHLHLGDFYVQSLDMITNTSNLPVDPRSTGAGDLRVAPSMLSAKINFTLVFRNPNRVGARYSSTTFVVRNQLAELGRVKLPEMYLRRRQNVEQIIPWRTNNVSGIGELSDDTFYFKIDGRARARLSILGISSPPVKVKFSCSIGIQISSKNIIEKKCGG